MARNKYNFIFLKILILILLLCNTTPALSGTTQDIAQVKRAIVIIKDSRYNKPLGTGFLVKPTGLILTSFSVVKGRSKVYVQFVDKGDLIGNIIKVNKKANLALIKVRGKNFPFIKLADSGDINVMDEVIAMGYPFSGQKNYFKGNIYDIKRAEKLRWLEKISSDRKKNNPFNSLILIKTDINVIPALHKGTPLLNSNGHAIGVNILTYYKTRDFLYAVAINKVFEVFPDEFEKRYKGSARLGKGKLDCTTRGISYAMYVPSYYTPHKKWPLILAFHPNGDGRKIRNVWIKEAEKNGFIIACGNTGKNNLWNTEDDYKIFKMIEDVYKTYKIDKKRIYLTGLSNGAVFSYYLGINYPDFFAAVASISGCAFSVDSELEYSRNSKKHIPVLMVQGSKDTTVPKELVKKSKKKLRDFGYKVLYLEVKGMGHDHTPYRDGIYERIAAFFKSIKRS